MPVTVRVARHDAGPWPAGWQPPTATASSSSSSPPPTSQSVLTTLNHKKQDEIGAVLQTALGPQTSLPDARLQDMRLRVQDHGLVRAALEAYNYHHHLVLRPEDVWFAVLTQFSFFVNAHAEELRSVDPDQPDMGLMCRNMTKLIDANVVDPELRAWIMPAFSTTTMHDEVVASVIMMGTLQKYFDYAFDCSCCGIPTVTLLGERSDWEDIQRRIEKLSDSESRLKPTIEQSKNLEKASAPSNKSTSDGKGTSNNQILDTLRPVTGWWIYKVKDSKNSGTSRDEFYTTKMAGDWNGQTSTGYVNHKPSTVELSVEDADGQVGIDGEEGRAHSSRC
ncbi:hypothetical protein QBC33DRAFT_620912 [Phialemonium atrogriseum]|uniref:Uncharacterized protein n=1 Tax=Phialemonium atrogriseum TaxID=1093897 RepID=A0AAJ0FMD3_9PEZI|nr:uncharacterized protein QBC33DRAFT_620912 [Phialemonium atrogriseum]KAK1766020.1 hypothetical protein QBC33DRAFT_620912 [Phialemonium atrogriseum]